MNEDEKAAFRSAIEKSGKTCRRVESLRGVIFELTRQLVLIREEAETVNDDLQRLFSQLNWKEDLCSQSPNG